MRTVEVVAALIIDKNKVCICQRKEKDSFSLLWEFPGGRIEAKETLSGAIKREIKEELGLEIEPIKIIGNFKDTISKLTINVHLFLCRIVKGKPLPLECADVRFVSIDELSKFSLAPVDKKIATYLNNHKDLLSSM